MTGRSLDFRREGSAIGLGLAASVIAMIVAPQATMAGLAATSGWAPHGVVLLAGVIAYEIGLWSSGLAVLLLAWRLGYGRQRLPVFIVFVTVLIAEMALSRLLNTPPAAYAWLTGILVRLLAAGLTLGLALRLTQPRK